MESTDRPPDRSARRGIAAEVALLVLLLALGALVRFDDAADWKRSPAVHLHEGQPLLANFDGYLYLALARDLREGAYARIDERRATPDHPRRPWPPPPLSILTAGLASLSSLSLERVAALLPPILALALALPVWAFGRRWGGPAMACTAVMLALLSRHYVYRTSLAVFDTDCLNVAFPFGAAWCFLRFGTGEGRRRYAWLAAGLALCVLYVWWWNVSPVPALVLGGSGLAVALALFYRPPRAEARRFTVVAAAAVAVALLVLGVERIAGLAGDVARTAGYVAKRQAAEFPAMGLTVNEQASFGWSDLASRTAGDPLTFALCLAGLGFLAARRPRESAFLLLPLALGISSVALGQRFAIFLAPVAALGLGALAAEALRLARGRRWAGALVVLAVSFVGWRHVDLDTPLRPSYPPSVVEGMRALRDATPSDAVVWSWWDEGYPLIYWSDRATVNDGQYHGPQRTVYTAIPLATPDLRLAANFMHFYVRRGPGGIDRLRDALDGDLARALRVARAALAAGPAGAAPLLEAEGLAPAAPWIDLLYPADPRPVYLFLTERHAGRIPLIYWMGTWDPERRTGERPLISAPLGAFTLRGETFSTSAWTIDLGSGRVADRAGQTFELASSAVTDERTTRYREYGVDREASFHFDPATVAPAARELFANRGPCQLEVVTPLRHAILQDHRLGQSAINRLYWRRTPGGPYFREVLVRRPAYRVFEVRGDARLR